MTLNDLEWLNSLFYFMNLPTSNSPRTVDYFYRMRVLLVAAPTNSIDHQVIYVTVSLWATVRFRCFSVQQLVS